MKFTIEIDPELQPDAVGEYLRSRLFDEKMITPKPYMSCFSGMVQGEPYRETGCYSTFDWAEGVTPLPDHVEELKDVSDPKYDETITWTRAELRMTVGTEIVQLICRYYWDGDGTLIFEFPDGSKLVNDDCKKDHGWKYYEPGEEY